MIHHPESTEGWRKRTTISVVVLEDSGHSLRAIILRQLPNLDRWDLSIQFNPAFEPGQAENVVFRGFNPQSSIYQWSTELMADGEDPVRYLGSTLRLNVYEQDPYC